MRPFTLCVAYRQRTWVLEPVEVEVSGGQSLEGWNGLLGRGRACTDESICGIDTIVAENAEDEDEGGASVGDGTMADTLAR